MTSIGFNNPFEIDGDALLKKIKEDDLRIEATPENCNYTREEVLYGFAGVLAYICGQKSSIDRIMFEHFAEQIVAGASLLQKRATAKRLGEPDPLADEVVQQ